MSRDITPFALRMPPEMRTRVEASAKEKRRSLNAELLARLESTFAEEDRVLHMDLGEYASEILAAVDAEATAAQAPELARRLSVVEDQLQQVIALLKDLKR